MHKFVLRLIVVALQALLRVRVLIQRHGMDAGKEQTGTGKNQNARRLENNTMEIDDKAT